MHGRTASGNQDGSVGSRKRGRSEGAVTDEDATRNLRSGRDGRRSNGGIGDQGAWSGWAYWSRDGNGADLNGNGRGSRGDGGSWDDNRNGRLSLRDCGGSRGDSRWAIRGCICDSTKLTSVFIYGSELSASICILALDA